MTPAALVLALAIDEPPPRPPNVVVPGLHAVALMSVVRAVETVIWPDPFAKPEQFLPRYEEAYTKPPKFDGDQPFMRWDGDPVVVNVVGHGLYGSEFYLRARQCRFGWAGSLAASAGASIMWEYLFEANGARPSALDLVYTPLAGLALGELRYVIHRATRVTAIRAIVDPLGELERAAGTEC